MITYTKFFRQPAIWPALTRHLDQLPGRLTLFSGGCSTGEEAYSLALLLTEQGRDFEILAVDSDPAVIASARAGTYRTEDVMTQPGWGVLDPSAVDRHLTRHGQGYKVADHIAERVRFEVADLDDWSTLEWLPHPLHGAMVRNMWRYLSHLSQVTTAHELHTRLVLGGALALGVTDFIGPDLQLHLGWTRGVRQHFTKSEHHKLIYTT